MTALEVVMLKALIAVACVAVIAIAGLLFWNQHQEAVAHEALMKDARLRGSCSTTAPGKINQNASFIRAWCVDNGYLNY
jgi:hypothetical protein